MAATSRLTLFLEGLRAADILEPAHVDKLARADGDDPTPLARELVQRGLLTSFQVNQIVRGQAKSLVLGTYRLMDRLGEGGMGQVFKAYHKPMRRVVALKVIRQDRLDNPDAVKRFHREVQSTGQLVHPNIVVAYDAGQVGGTHYLAMEYIEGTDLLKQVKENGALPVATACDIIRQAAAGLQHAHERGLVHRDIKPSNLMVAGTGQVKVLDLGLARLQHTEGTNHTLTRIGAIVGTPEFLAPEQSKNASDVDIRADLYSLGCTFYYLLAGQVPFRGESATDVMLMHHTDQAASLETFRGDVPPGVQAIVKKLMAKKPEDRYQKPDELVAALTPFCRGGKEAANSQAIQKQRPAAGIKAAAAMPAGAVRVRRKARSRGKKRAAILLGVLVLAAFVALGVAVYANLGPSSPDDPSSTRPLAGVNPARATQLGSQPQQSTSQAPPTQPAHPPKPTQFAAPTFVRLPPGTQAGPPQTKRTEEPKTAATEPKPGNRKQLPDYKKVQDARQALQQERKLDGNPKTPIQDRVDAARKVLKEATETKDDVVRQVALLLLASDAWAWAGDLDMTLACYDELGKRYETDGLTWKINHLELAASRKLPATLLRVIAVKSLSVLDQGIRDDQYDGAAKLLAIADDLAKKLGDKPLEAHVQQRQRELAEIRAEYARVKPLLNQKQLEPHDAGKVGTFLALFKGVWEQGLRDLSRGDRPNLKALAERDLGGAKAPAEQQDLGDAWDKLAEAFSGVARTNAHLRARHWYALAAAQLPDGDAQQSLTKKIADADRLTGRDALADALSDPKLLKLLESARMAYNQGKEAEMLQGYREALKLLPDNLLGREQGQQIRYEMAMAKGLIAMVRKKYAEAAKEFESALAENPGDPTALAKRNEARQLAAKK